MSQVLLLLLHVRVPEVFVAFATTPEDVVFGTQALADFQAVLELRRRVGEDLRVRGAGGTSEEARVIEEVARVPEELNAGVLLVLLDTVHNLVEVGVRLAKRITLGGDVTIVEAEVLDAELLVELERVLHLRQREVHRIGDVVVGADGGAGAERIDEACIEGVPVRHREAEPLAHFLTCHNLVWLVVVEAEILRYILVADERELFYVPKVTHDCSFREGRRTLFRATAFSLFTFLTKYG